eukprot:1290081-Pleurochrysis_carterae.AAC.6
MFCSRSSVRSSWRLATSSSVAWLGWLDGSNVVLKIGATPCVDKKPGSGVVGPEKMAFVTACFSFCSSCGATMTSAKSDTTTALHTLSMYMCASVHTGAVTKGRLAKPTSRALHTARSLSGPRAALCGK